jgi:hypothetical protein
VGALLVVVAPVDRESDLGVGQVVEHLDVEAVASQRGVEALDEGVLPERCTITRRAPVRSRPVREAWLVALSALQMDASFLGALRAMRVHQQLRCTGR